MRLEADSTQRREINVQQLSMQITQSAIKAAGLSRAIAGDVQLGQAAHGPTIRRALLNGYSVQLNVRRS